MAYMSLIIRFGIKTADQTMGFGGIGKKAKQAQQALQAGYDQVYLARPVRGGARVLPRPAKKDHTPRREK